MANRSIELTAHEVPTMLTGVDVACILDQLGFGNSTRTFCDDQIQAAPSQASVGPQRIRIRRNHALDSLPGNATASDDDVDYDLLMADAGYFDPLAFTGA